MDKLTFWEDIMDEYEDDTWKPCEQDFAEFLKEQEDELEYYKSEKFEPYEGHIKSLKKDIEEFKEADFDEKVKLIKSHIYCYCDVCPVESYSSLWRRVLGIEVSL